MIAEVLPKWCWQTLAYNFSLAALGEFPVNTTISQYLTTYVASAELLPTIMNWLK